MAKYYVVKVNRKEGNQLLEVIEANNEREARKQAVMKYKEIVLSMVNQLAVVTKAAYEQYYKA